MTGHGSHLRSVQNGRFFLSLETHRPHEGAWLKTVPRDKSVSLFLCSRLCLGPRFPGPPAPQGFRLT